MATRLHSARRGRVLAAAAGCGMPLILVVALRTLSPGPFGAGAPADEWARLSACMLLFEAASVIVMAPVAGVASVQRWRTRSSGPPVAAAPFVPRVLAIAAPLLAGATTLVVLSALVHLIIMTAAVPIVLRTHVMLWGSTVALAAMGAVCAALFADPLDAAACALGLAITSGTTVLVAGPALMAVPARVIAVLLLANPIVVITSAASIDIFRTPLLYRISPLAHMKIDYPSAPLSFAVYAVVAVTLFTASALLLERRGRVLSLERTFA